MTDFTSLPGEVKLCIMERAQSFTDLANLCATNRELSALLKLFNKQIVASVSRNYPEISPNFTQEIFRANERMDAVVTSLAPGANGAPLVTYSIAEGEPCTLDEVAKVRSYHHINAELKDLVDLFYVDSDVHIYAPVFDTKWTESRPLYMSALCKLLHTLSLAEGMKGCGIDPSDEHYDHPSLTEMEHGKQLTQPLNEAKKNFVIQSLNKLPFDELVTVGDILLMARFYMQYKAKSGSLPFQHNAPNDLYEMICDYLTSGEMHSMLLLAQVWVLIRRHPDRDNSIAARHGLTYKTAQAHVFQKVAKNIDTRGFHGQIEVPRGELPKIERDYRMSGSDARLIATADVYEAIGM